jgi:hypothetical protein
MEILYLSGFSRSGKSTVLSKLDAYNFISLSTSAYLTECTLAHFNEPLSNADLVTNKDTDYDKFFKDVYGLGIREAKIHVAEDVIVPKLGRKEGLVRPAIFKTLPKSLKCIPYVVCEVFNLEELTAWESVLSDLVLAQGLTYSPTHLALRRTAELTDVDGRELIGKNVFNNGIIENTISSILWEVSKNSIQNKPDAYKNTNDGAILI